MENKPFNRSLLRRQMARRAGEFGDASFLYQEIVESLSERLQYINRRFDTALWLGARQECPAALDVKHLFSASLIQGDVICDEEFLPFRSQSLDLIFCPWGLHFVNDLPGALAQMRHALKPDGLLLAAFPGGETLKELRDCLLRAESELAGGVAPRISPFVDMRDAGGLLQRAGFSLPVTDKDALNVRYRNPMRLLTDLRQMGEANILNSRSNRPLRRDVLMAAMADYIDRYSDEDGTVPATFEIVTLTGWAPHPDQQQPLRPGSAKASLAEALGSTEIKLED